MGRFGRGLVAGLVVVSVVGPFGATETGVAWAKPPTSVACGTVITQSTALANDVGPCTGDGIVVAADKVKLDLDGHKVFGSPAVGSAGAAGQDVGITFRNTTHSEVRNGEVTGFSAGVRINGGASDTVRDLNVHDNIGPRATDNNGDGIAVWNSSYNMIENNLVAHNGPFSGIALVTGPYLNFTDPAVNATGNQIRGNHVLNNNVAVCNSAAGCAPRDPDTGVPSTTKVPRGALTTGSLDAGIRIEGPNETSTQVERNAVRDSGIDGIFVMASCHNAFMPNPTQATACLGDTGNIHALIKNNQADHNGYGGGGSGIDLWAMLGLPGALPATYGTLVGNSAQLNYTDGVQLSSTCDVGDDPARCATNHNDIMRNNASNNRKDGIGVEGGSTSNTIEKNTVNDNGNIGLELAEGASGNSLFSNQGSGNTVFDGADKNATCASNVWSHNQFPTVNQPCVLDSATTPDRAARTATGGGAYRGTGGAGESAPRADRQQVLSTARQARAAGPGLEARSSSSVSAARPLRGS